MGKGLVLDYPTSTQRIFYDYEGDLVFYNSLFNPRGELAS